VHLRLGIDIACRTAHQASLADQTGRLRWRGYRFCTTTAELDRLWQCLPAGTDPAEVTVVTEPTRNAWVPLAAWFRPRGASVVLPAAGTPGRPARLGPQAHQDRPAGRHAAGPAAAGCTPTGSRPEHGLGPADPLRRQTKLRATLVKRRTTTLARPDALLELLGPGWLAALGADLANKTPLRLLAAR
jgi:hypothetical protein